MRVGEGLASPSHKTTLYSPSVDAPADGNCVLQSLRMQKRLRNATP